MPEKKAIKALELTLIMALVEMNQTFINAAKAGKSLRKIMLKMEKKKKKKNA